jgi:septal ring factor EnvC (AmiA/AmiB activator)
VRQTQCVKRDASRGRSWRTILNHLNAFARNHSILLELLSQWATIMSFPMNHDGDLMHAVRAAKEQLSALESEFETARTAALTDSAKRREMAEHELCQIEDRNGKLSQQIAVLTAALNAAWSQHEETAIRLALPWICLVFGIATLLVHKRATAAACALACFLVAGYVARLVGDKSV